MPLYGCHDDAAEVAARSGAGHGQVDGHFVVGWVQGDGENADEGMVCGQWGEVGHVNIVGDYEWQGAAALLVVLSLNDCCLSLDLGKSHGAQGDTERLSTRSGAGGGDTTGSRRHIRNSNSAFHLNLIVSRSPPREYCQSVKILMQHRCHVISV